MEAGYFVHKVEALVLKIKEYSLNDLINKNFLKVKVTSQLYTDSKFWGFFGRINLIIMTSKSVEYLIVKESITIMKEFSEFKYFFFKHS